jgi:hypothetical protein
MKPLWLMCLLLIITGGAGRAQAPAEQPLMFVADLRGQLVAPAAVDTAATSKATAVLVGNRFTVHGSFSGLSSPLRDFEKTPDDPGVHLHRGAPGQTTPYFHGLQVRLNADGRSGIFFGTATLDADQLKRLLATETYVDIHTVKHGPGEVRDQWRPLDASAAAERKAALEHPDLRPEHHLETGSCHR